ncbi:MAG: hypothetical protein ACI4OT_04700 [Bacilli bacterium]
MNDKELALNKAHEYFNGKLLRIVIEQIELFYEISAKNTTIKNNYKIGDDVVLTDNHLLHGIGDHYDKLDLFSERGIISNDYFSNQLGNHAFIYNSAFWTVDKNIKLKDFIINYSGMIAKYNDTYEIVPYGQLDSFVEKMKEVNHWSWTAESSMEIRFMPSLARNINQFAFILNLNDFPAKELRKNSIFKNKDLEKYSLTFIHERANKDEIKKSKKDVFDRTDYIIFGIPKNYIEGILVGRIFEKDINKLKEIKSLFPSCYICNLDGKVIM